MLAEAVVHAADLPFARNMSKLETMSYESLYVGEFEPHKAVYPLQDEISTAADSVSKLGRQVGHGSLADTHNHPCIREAIMWALLPNAQRVVFDVAIVSEAARPRECVNEVPNFTELFSHLLHRPRLAGVNNLKYQVLA